MRCAALSDATRLPLFFAIAAALRDTIIVLLYAARLIIFA